MPQWNWARLNWSIYIFKPPPLPYQIYQNFCKIVGKFGNIDIVFFSTGIHDPKSEKKLNLEKIRIIMETNFFGTINCINSVYNYFKEKKSGHIGGSFSMAELVSVLYDDYDIGGKDKFILSRHLPSL